MTSTPSTRSQRPSLGSAEAPSAARNRVSPWAALLVGVATVLALVAIDVVDPYYTVARAFTPGDGGASLENQIPDVDPTTNDPLHGANLLETHSTRAQPAADVSLILVSGNSQQFTVAQPAGRPAHEAQLMSDLFAAALERRAPGRFAVYNASAPNQTFVEQLWQGLYWFRVAPRAPAALIIASSFDTYRKAGIRYGFQTLLDLPAFDAALDPYSVADKAYADELAAAKTAFAEQRAAGLTVEQQEDETFEGRIREQMEVFAPYRERQTHKVKLYDLLYRVRVAAGLSPTARRHITGQPWAANWAALEDYVKLARAAGAQVAIYNAPVNPAVSMFYDDEYRAYVRGLQELAMREGCLFADFGGVVPPEHWGQLLDGPDPIHFDQVAHRQMADRLDAAFGPKLVESLAR